MIVALRDRALEVGVFLYSVIAYVLFVIALLWAVGFVGNLGAPTSVDSSLSNSTVQGLAIDLSLLGLFALQHSVMARAGFKRRWLRVVPQPVERSTYVLCASLALLLLFWQWRPLPAVIWEVDEPVARALVWGMFALGWMIAIVATFLINHADLFGLRQAAAFWRHRATGPMPFKTTFLYSVVRHPLMLGLILAFWATPRMTIGHMLFAAASTLYVLIGIRLEERDLRRQFGDVYAAYQASVPMLVPGRRGASRTLNQRSIEA